MALNSALMNDMVKVCSRKGFARATGKTYRHWCEQFLLWGKKEHGSWQHPKDLGRDGVEAWLTWLAVHRRVSPTTQNVALQSALFLFREVLKIDLKGIDALRAKRPQRIPSVLSPSEVSQLFRHLNGHSLLIGQLLYGAGLRIGEAISLRLKDIDFSQRQIIVRAAKGAKDRVCQLPLLLVEPLKKQVAVAESWHAEDTKKRMLSCRTAVCDGQKIAVSPQLPHVVVAVPVALLEPSS